MKVGIVLAAEIKDIFLVLLNRKQTEMVRATKDPIKTIQTFGVNGRMMAVHFGCVRALSNSFSIFYFRC